MYWKDKAVLVALEKAPNEHGYQDIIRAVRREVFANRKSVTRAEFYAARQTGTKISLVLEVRAADYHEETRLEFAGRPYEVIRAYTKSGEIYELNCAEAGEDE